MSSEPRHRQVPTQISKLTFSAYRGSFVLMLITIRCLYCLGSMELSWSGSSKACMTASEPVRTARALHSMLHFVRNISIEIWQFL